MSRVFELPFSGIVSPGTNPFVQLATPSTAAVRILRVELGQTGYGTGGMERLTATIRSTATTFTTGVTPVTLDDTVNVASLCVSGTTACAQTYSSGSGTIQRTYTLAPFYNLQGLLFTPIPEEMIKVTVSRFFTLQFVAAPAGTSTPSWAGRIVYAEE